MELNGAESTDKLMGHDGTVDGKNRTVREILKKISLGHWRKTEQKLRMNRRGKIELWVVKRDGKSRTQLVNNILVAK